MFAETSLTDYLSLIFGIYLLAAGIGLLLDVERYQRMYLGFVDHPALTYIGAVIAFGLGAVLLRIHNEWGSLREGFISLIAWGALIEGVLMLAIPEAYLRSFMAIGQSRNLMKGLSVFCFVAGGWLVASVLLHTQ